MDSQTGNLYSKLCSIQKELGPLEKTGRMEIGKGYKFVQAEELFAVLRKKLSTYGVCIIPSITSISSTPGNEKVTTFGMEFTIINADNPEERITLPWIAQSFNNDDKSASKASTVGEKYFLMKLFLMTDSKDPEQEEADKRDAVAQEIIARVQRAVKVIGNRAPDSDETRELTKIRNTAQQLLPDFVFTSGNTILEDVIEIASALKG